MKKLLSSIISNIIMILLPLLPKPQLMVHPKILILISAGVAIWLTQPVFSVQETQDKKDTDKSSVMLILLMSLVSIAVPIMLWAYTMENRDNYNIFFVLGCFMIVSGLLYRAWAVRKLGKYFRPTVHIQTDHNLVTAGPYKRVRHPSYTGAFLTITGCALILGSLVGYAIACLSMAVAYKVRITIEERELEAHFGDQYRLYKRQSKKLIPFLW